MNPTRTIVFSFGQGHEHVIDGVIFNKDCLVRITAENPRQVMFDVFGAKWCFEYDDARVPDIIHHFPRGVIDLPASCHKPATSETTNNQTKP